MTWPFPVGLDARHMFPRAVETLAETFSESNKKSQKAYASWPGISMVGVTRFELVASSVSGKRSPPELNAHRLIRLCGSSAGEKNTGLMVPWQAQSLHCMPSTYFRQNYDLGLVSARRPYALAAGSRLSIFTRRTQVPRPEARGVMEMESASMSMSLMPRPRSSDSWGSSSPFS